MISISWFGQAVWISSSSDSSFSFSNFTNFGSFPILGQSQEVVYSNCSSSFSCENSLLASSGSPGVFGSSGIAVPGNAFA